VGIKIPMSVNRHYATVILSRMPKPWVETLSSTRILTVLPSQVLNFL